jgi:hypothetical protein
MFRGLARRDSRHPRLLVGNPSGSNLDLLIHRSFVRSPLVSAVTSHQASNPFLMPSAAPPNESSPQIELLRAAYAAFNARDIDAALSLMTPDVAWPRAFKGGFVRGPEEVRAYWTEQWSEIDPKVEPLTFHSEDAGRILVEVHQVVRDKAGTLLAEERVGHRFTFEDGLIQSMEVCSIH